MRKILNEKNTNELRTHTMQKIIKFVSNKEEFKFLLISFNGLYRITMISLNQYGTHVIQKLFVHIPEKHRILFNFVLKNL